MINTDPNMSRKQIFKELPVPSKVEDKDLLRVIYKGVFIAVKLLLDNRLNIVKLSEGKKIATKHAEKKPGRNERPNRSKPKASELQNTVIKDTDKVQVQEQKKEDNADTKKTDGKTDK